MIDRIVGAEPPDYAQINVWIERLGHKYSPMLELINVGESLLGRNIHGLLIGNPARTVLYFGGVHGREWITSLLLMRFAEDLLQSYSRRAKVCGMEVCRLLDAKGVVIVPSLNPDGVEISINGAERAGLSPELTGEEAALCAGTSRRWKSNARGVDINRNFDADWAKMRDIAAEQGIIGPSAGGWGGKSPESEPETRAIIRLCEFMRFRHAIAFHSQGEEIYWSYGSSTPPKAHLMAQILSASSGYPLNEPDRSAACAGFKEWFMSKYSAPAFTVEVGRGECPIPIESFRFLYSRLREMLLLGLAM